MNADGWKNYTIEGICYDVVVTVNDSTLGIAQGSEIDCYDTIAINAHPTFGHFIQWSDGNTENPRSLVVTHDTSFMAIFAKNYDGVCGEELNWQYSDKTLYIRGDGDMYGYHVDSVPWFLFRDSITQIVINNGCTSIGENAFNKISNVTNIELPSTILTIGAYAFANCSKLRSFTLGAGTTNIEANAFTGDAKLYEITCYAQDPPTIQNNTFANYSAYLHIPCDAERYYSITEGWKKFENVECIGATDTPATNVSVTPGMTDATFTWPANSNANSYSIEIKKDGVMFCTLVFNAQGQLTSIAFAPSRDGGRQIPAAEQTASGWKFTVTGLDAASKYIYDLDVRNASEQSIKNYQGQFQTTGTTTLDHLTDSPVDRFTKIIQDGQLYIMRDGKTYNAQGGEL